MEISVLGLIGGVLAAMFFGYFFGLFEGRGQGYRSRQKQEEIERQAQSSLPSLTPTAATRAPDGSNLLELSQDETGRPVLRLDGRPVDAGNNASETRKRLIELMVLLRPWVEPNAASAPAAAPVPIPDSSTSSIAGPVHVGATKKKGQPVKAGTTAGGATEPPAKAVPPMSLVAQIDSILQARLAGSPLAERGIRLAEALHGGAIVFVGTSQYDGVDKVPDSEIQAAIRAAIAEWEKNTPS
jgi:hypothetical protein